MKDIEIEIQVKVSNVTPLVSFLKKAGKFVGQKKQSDEYFSPVKGGFLKVRPIREWLRLRDNDGSYLINYKNWHFDKEGRGIYCDEYESKVKKSDQVRKILRALNFKPIVKVEKVRKIWNWKEWEIAVDSVKKLGDFVEIEYKGTVKVDPKQVTTNMINFLKDLGCGRIERHYGGYPALMLFPEEEKFEVQ